jgi:hypothetical protein
MTELHYVRPPEMSQQELRDILNKAVATGDTTILQSMVDAALAAD